MPVARRSVLAALAATLLTPGLAAAQIIPIKTVPLADGDQFGFFPSQNLGMGGVAIALPDTTLDPFGNPATAARFRQRWFFGAPSFFAVSSNAGSGQTLPLGGFFSSGNTFGGVALVAQQINPSRQRNDGGFIASPVDFRAPQNDVAFPPPVNPRRAETEGNQYGFAAIGHRLPGRGLSVAASVLASGLHAMDGVDVLYAGSQSVRQRGRTLDVRLGALKEWKDGASLEGVLAHNRYSMAHDPQYIDNYWDPTFRMVLPKERVEHNLDRTRTYGAHVAYERPLAHGWRAGGLATANLLDHPRIASYEVLSIPRNPGRSTAYNLGVGVARAAGRTTFGVDAIYEPILSHTWSDAADNRFAFSNGIVRAGASRDFTLIPDQATARLQLGLQGRGIHYRLTQKDLARGTTTSSVEQWGELTRYWGASLRFTGVELHYRGRMMSGAGRPGVNQPIFGGCPTCLTVDASSLTGPNIVAASSAPMHLDAVNVVAHQISLTLPIR